jgi:hypothetical protein
MMKQVGMDIVPPRHRRRHGARRQALLDDACLLRRRLTPPPLMTRKNRNCRHVCPLTRQLTGLISHARTSPQRRPTPDAY